MGFWQPQSSERRRISQARVSRWSLRQPGGALFRFAQGKDRFACGGSPLGPLMRVSVAMSIVILLSLLVARDTDPRTDCYAISRRLRPFCLCAGFRWSRTPPRERSTSGLVRLLVRRGDPRRPLVRDDLGRTARHPLRLPFSKFALSKLRSSRRPLLYTPDRARAPHESSPDPVGPVVSCSGFALMLAQRDPRNADHGRSFRSSL